MAFANSTALKRCGACRKPEKFFKMLTSAWPEDTVDDPQQIEDDPNYVGPREGAVSSDQHVGHMGKKAYKICVDCELKKRLKYVETKEYKEGDLSKDELMKEYATPVGVMKDLKKEVKGARWATQCLYLNEVKRRMVAVAGGEDEDMEVPEEWKNLDFSVMNSRQRFQVRKQFARDMASSMINALTTGGMMDAFLKAGERFAALSVSDAVVGISEAYEKYMAEPTKENLDDLEQKEMTIMEAEDFTTAGHRDDQVAVLKALDFSDQIAPNWRMFNCCRAKVVTNTNESESCGCAMPAAFWSQPNKATWKFYCKMDWEVLVNAGCWDGAPEHVKNWASNMVKAYGRDWKMWPQVGCGARFVPWSRGASIILELKCGDSWRAMMAVRPPPILLDEIFRVRYEFAVRLNAMSPDQIQKVMPICFPMNYVIDGRDGHFPGIAKFPVDQWIKEGRPIFDTASWCALCIHLVKSAGGGAQSSEAPDNLDKLFHIAKVLQSEME